MGTYLRDLGGTYPMNTNMSRVLMVFKKHAYLCLWIKVASALEGFKNYETKKSEMYSSLLYLET